MMIAPFKLPSSRFSRWIFSLILLLSLSFHVRATTYYVDSGQGNDSGAGTDEATPWKTVWKINKTSLQAGDKVLFKRGGAWSGQLTIHNAGNDGNPIYIGAYGDETAPKPIINGGGNVPTAVFIKNGANHVTVEGLAVTNFDGKDIFDGAEGNRCGIKAGEWGGDLSDIKILHNEVYDIEGFSNHPTVGPPRGTNLDPKKYNQYMAAAIFGNAAHMTGLTIDGNSIHDCTGTGLMVQAFTNVSGLLIQHNDLNNIGSDGIEILRATSPVVQYNSCVKAGNNSGTAERAPGVLGYHGVSACGMWAFASSDVLFQYNYCEGTRQIKYDGEAWDFDIGLTGTCIYQYNFSRDNEGGFLLTTCTSADQAKKQGLTMIVRFNISVNDGAKQGNGESFFNDYCDSYYNNIFYRTDGKSFFDDDKKLSSHMSGTFTNNIFHTTATTDVTYQTSTRIFSHNCYDGHVPVNPGSDAVIQDPLFEDSAGALATHSLQDLAGFKLKLGSPCQNVGEVIPNNGGKNFWGDPLPADKANIGAN